MAVTACTEVRPDDCRAVKAGRKTFAPRRDRPAGGPCRCVIFCSSSGGTALCACRREGPLRGFLADKLFAAQQLHVHEAAGLEAALAEVSADDSIHGCLLFRPLPKQFDDRTVRAALAPEKDIDGITDGSLAGVFTNTDLGYAPCTAQACLEILKHYNVPLSGKRAVVVGRSLVVGKPAAMMLDRENATVTLCNSRTRNLPEVCRQADIVVVAMGKMGAVGADCLREGQTVVDVGIHVNEEGKLCGDVQFAAAEPVVDAITPVPGGVGTVTTSVLVGHVVQAACKKAGV